MKTLVMTFFKTKRTLIGGEKPHRVTSPQSNVVSPKSYSHQYFWKCYKIKTFENIKITLFPIKTNVYFNWKMINVNYNLIKLH